MDKLLRNFRQAEESISDFRQLYSGSAPFVDQFHHHVFELYSKLHTEKNKSTQEFPQLDKMFYRQFKKYARHILFGLDDGQLFISKESKIGFRSWERIYLVLPEITRLTKHIRFRGNCQLGLRNEWVLLSGEIEDQDWTEDFKNSLVKITTRLLKSDVYLTFRVSPTEKEGRYYLNLLADISFADDQLYCFHIEDQNIRLCFPGNYKNYILGQDLMENLTNHICLEILPNLRLKRHRKLPQRFLKRSKDSGFKKTLIHFPFLFRPLSLIIPTKGEMYLANRLNLENREQPATKPLSYNHITGSGQDASKEPGKSEIRDVYFNLFDFLP